MTRKVIPRYRFFKCPECEFEWKSPCRDAQTMSTELCPNHCNNSICIGEYVTPHAFELHPEWPTDKCGNLVNRKLY
jgi:hypothetical protein